MNIRLLFSSFCGSTFCMAIGLGLWMATLPSVTPNPTFSVAQAATDQNSSPPGSSRGEERRSPAPKTF